ncbi:MAG: hypothetical protein U0Z26_09780 [Anaerolineales bacterium]
MAPNPNQPFEPKISSKQLPSGKQIVSAPMEDMFLSLEEFMGNLFIPLEEE